MESFIELLGINEFEFKILLGLIGFGSVGLYGVYSYNNRFSYREDSKEEPQQLQKKDKSEVIHKGSSEFNWNVYSNEKIKLMEKVIGLNFWENENELNNRIDELINEFNEKNSVSLCLITFYLLIDKYKHSVVLNKDGNYKIYEKDLLTFISNLKLSHENKQKINSIKKEFASNYNFEIDATRIFYIMKNIELIGEEKYDNRFQEFNISEEQINGKIKTIIIETFDDEEKDQIELKELEDILNKKTTDENEKEKSISTSFEFYKKNLIIEETENNFFIKLKDGTKIKKTGLCSFEVIETASNDRKEENKKRNNIQHEDVVDLEDIEIGTEHQEEEIIEEINQRNNETDQNSIEKDKASKVKTIEKDIVVTFNNQDSKLFSILKLTSILALRIELSELNKKDMLNILIHIFNKKLVGDDKYKLIQFNEKFYISSEYLYFYIFYLTGAIKKDLNTIIKNNEIDQKKSSKIIKDFFTLVEQIIGFPMTHKKNIKTTIFFSDKDEISIEYFLIEKNFIENLKIIDNDILNSFYKIDISTKKKQDIEYKKYSLVEEILLLKELKND